MKDKRRLPRPITVSKKEFFCLEEMPDYYPMMAGIAWNTGQANKFFSSRGLKKRFSCLATTYQDNICRLLVVPGEFRAASREVLARVKKDKKWGEKYFRDIREAEDRLYRASAVLQRMKLDKLSDRELFKVYDDYYRIYTSLHVLHWAQTVADFVDNTFSRYLKGYLKKRIGRQNYSLGDVFSTLTTPTEIAKPAEEYEELLKILDYIVRRPKIETCFRRKKADKIATVLAKLDRRLSLMLSKHASDFGWLGYNTVGPAWGQEYFIDILSSLVRQGLDPSAAIREIKDGRLEIARRQKKLVEALKIDQCHADMFAFARGLVLSKGTRKDAMFNSYSVIERLFREIGRRRYLSLRQVRYLYPPEFERLLLGRDFDTSVLNARYRFNLYYSVGDCGDDLIASGDEAKSIYARMRVAKENIKNVRSLSGDCAFPGQAKGFAKIINQTDDISKMKKGNILISVATTPNLVPAMKLAAAIVTDAGGITCHAAIVSRELKIPCVVGTKIATKVLHDGDLVEVDAEKGTVKIIKKK